MSYLVISPYALSKRWYFDDQDSNKGDSFYYKVDFGGDIFWWCDKRTLHRLEGPAIEYANGSKFWFYRGKCIPCSSQRDFEKYIKLLAFI